MLQVNLLHLLVQGPLLAYIGYHKEQTPDKVFTLLLVMGLMIPFIVRFPTKKNVKADYKKILYMHYLFIMPAFIYIGYQGKKINPKFYQPLFFTGLIVALYHAYKVSQRI